MISTISKFTTATLLALTLLTAGAQANDNGVVRVRSAYSMEESIARVKADLAAKGITFFDEIDQAALAAKAGIKMRRSTLLVFGNPALGTQFVTANPDAGLDWPVRMLLSQDDAGTVWAIYSDFGWIARRHAIDNREGQFAMATQVIGSILSTLTEK